jgi:hypothetical protein
MVNNAAALYGLRKPITLTVEIHDTHIPLKPIPDHQYSQITE